jgi:hypothetical protein
MTSMIQSPAAQNIDPRHVPQFGTNLLSAEVSSIFNQYPVKHIILRHIPNDTLIIKESLSIGPLLSEVGACLTIYTPPAAYNNEKRVFKNGQADILWTTHKVIFLENFTFGEIHFMDISGNSIKGKIFKDRGSQILKPEHTDAMIIQLRDKRFEKKSKHYNQHPWL